MKVEFFRHGLGKEELDSLAGALNSVMLTTGPQTHEFEESFARYLGVRQVVGVSSCTAALVLTLRALGVGPGHEVITSPMTFIATSNAVLEVGATPVFADVEPRTGNLDASLVEAAITPRTRAIIPVHLYGQMADMEKLSRLARRHGLFLVEDAAHCVEGRRDGAGPGTLGDAACFSFYATKALTAGEGGAVATNDPKLAKELKTLRSHGMSREAASRYQGPYQHWDMVGFGYKANLSDIQAALLLPQIPNLDERREQRAGIAEKYRAALYGKKGLDGPDILPGTRHAHHLFTVWTRPGLRDQSLARLNQAGVGCAVNYRAVHLLSYYRKKFGFAPGAFPVAEDIGDRTLSLPLWPGLGQEEIDHVTASLLGPA